VVGAMEDRVKPEERAILEFLDGANTPLRFHHLADFPAGRHALLDDMEARGLVERRRVPKQARGPVRPAFWRITDAGQKALAAVSHRPEERRAVVRWLRDPATCPDPTHTEEACDGCEFRRGPAFAIERGEHRRGEER
jgi:hypothetical protein